MISNYKEFKQQLDKLDKNSKPKLLLHSCCAPCSSHVLCLLNDYFNITILYDNSNIFPIEEFDRRYLEQVELIKKLGIKVEVYKGIYNHFDFLDSIKDLESLGERSFRCYKCYELRLRNAFLFAKEHKFDYFSTTLSISPYKNSEWINEIGFRLEDENVRFLYSDFKKEQGYLHSIELSKQYGLYRQDYCGCEFSKKEKEERVKNVIIPNDLKKN